MIERSLSGEQLADAIEAEAVRRRVSVQKLLRPLSREGGKYLYQLRNALHPKPATFDRIEALLSGAALPPPPPNNFRKASGHRPPLAPAPRDQGHCRPRIADRTPCPRCGVRADVGCRHQVAPERARA